MFSLRSVDASVLATFATSPLSPVLQARYGWAISSIGTNTGRWSNGHLRSKIPADSSQFPMTWRASVSTHSGLRTMRALRSVERPLYQRKSISGNERGRLTPVFLRGLFGFAQDFEDTRPAHFRR